ncbi:MAG: DHH family phosphoesterase [Firmicutes bacterium]|nr:DHH family phosphoesterase [Bacillota bacterium]
MPESAPKEKKAKKTAGTPLIGSDVLLYIVTAVLCLAAASYVCAVSGLYIIGVVPILIYIIASLLITLVLRRRKIVSVDEEKVSSYLNEILADAMTSASTPSAITTSGGGIVWTNGAFDSLAVSLGARRNLRGRQFSTVIPQSWDKIAGSRESSGNPVSFDGNSFNIESYPFRVSGHMFYMISVYDRTETESLIRELDENRTIVAHIAIDNLTELSQYEHGEYRNASRDVDAVLKDFTDSTGGVIREYERGRYILFFDKKHLEEMKSRRFDVLDRVRDVRIGQNFMPVTISVGIALTGDSLYERERASFAALDTALQRGGDQVVLRTADSTEFYGGRTKSVQKLSKTRSRVIAGELASLICRSGNVLIMGHRYPDFDSIGSCVGCARLAAHCGVEAHIIINPKEKAISEAARHVANLPGYETMFIDGSTALDMMRSDTLVIICDVNNFAMLEAPEVALKSPELVIIDHHIKTPNPPREAGLSYIEPSASSACELISDILEQEYRQGGLMPAEADVMYAGILLDTKKLSRNTSPRTFSAAMYLQSCGADPVKAADFFRDGLDDFTREAKFESNVVIYRGNIAISASNGSGVPEDRIAAAKAADKLLTVRGVSAAFAAVEIGGVVHISARSDGSVNVQIILEKLGGGGHFDVAGAQIKDSDVEAVLISLKGAIDEFLDSAEDKKTDVLSAD